MCFFFIKLKVFVNLTYLYYSSEIKKQGLIFSVGMGHLIICRKNLDLDRGFLSKPVFLLDACRASVELWMGKRFQSSWTWPYFLVYYTNKALVYYTSLDTKTSNAPLTGCHIILVRSPTITWINWRARNIGHTVYLVTSPRLAWISSSSFPMSQSEPLQKKYLRVM